MTCPTCEALHVRTCPHETAPTVKDMRYIGACSLLGRISAYVTDPEDLASIRHAMEDCVATFPGRLEIWDTATGLSLEPV